MYGSKQLSLASQRGVSVSGLIVFFAIALVLAMLGLKVIPYYIEYNAVKAAMSSARANGGTVAEIRSAFDRSADINSIKVITGRDLMITKVGNQNEIAVDYEPRIALSKNIALMIHFTHTTDPSGKMPEKVEAKPE
jgi:Tfp pilus assembly major pilin PilA